MSENEEEIRDIVEEFQRLHVQQSALVERLEVLTGNRAGPATRTTGPAVRVPRPIPRQAPARANNHLEDAQTGPATRLVRGPATREPIAVPRQGLARQFQIGDNVRVRNPGRTQAPLGVVSNITPTCIYVTSAQGTVLWRLPKNLILQEDE